jgi:hypothetical protein
MHLLILRFASRTRHPIKRGRGEEMGLGGFGGAGPEGPPNVTEGAGQAPPPTGCLRPYSFPFLSEGQVTDPTRSVNPERLRAGLVGG